MTIRFRLARTTGGDHGYEEILVKKYVVWLSDGEREQLAPLIRKGSCPARHLVGTASGARCRAIGDAWNARSLKGEPIIRLILGDIIVRVLYVGGYDPSKLHMSKVVYTPDNGQLERMNRTIKEPLSSASTLRAINSFESISRTSPTPITSDVGSILIR